MPYKRKDSRFWWVSYTDASGKRFRKPAGTTSQREAKALEKRWGEEANKDMADDPQAIREDKGDYQIQHGVKAESQETYQASSATALIQEEGCTTWTFDQLMLDYLRETGLIKKSAERDLYSAKQLRHFFAGMAIDAIGPNRIAEYKRNRRQDGVVDATVAKELRLLSAAINYARKE
ncbi:MAG: hypothetical protein OES26_26480, partial [Gammaproteobacteria bacterium]|nr:hypothetical protein [Gammaproteobacteria bacterium]